MSKLKMVLTIGHKVDVEKFMNAVITQVIGRYGDGFYTKDLAIPTIHYRGCYCGKYKAGKAYSIYEMDADELEPAMISVLYDFKEFADFDFDFRINGRNITDQNFWRISAEEMTDEGHDYGFEDADKYGKIYYDGTAAYYAAEIYDAKIAEYEQSA